MASHTSDLRIKIQPSEEPQATLSEILHLNVWAEDFTCVCYFKKTRSKRCDNWITWSCLRTAALLLEQTPDPICDLRLVLTDIARQLICETCNKNKVKNKISQTVPLWQHRVLGFLSGHGVEGQKQDQALLRYPQTPDGPYTVHSDMAGAGKLPPTNLTPPSSRPISPDLSTCFSTPEALTGQGQTLTGQGQTRTNHPFSPPLEGPANPFQVYITPSITPPSPTTRNLRGERIADTLQNSRPALDTLNAFLAKSTTRRRPVQRQPIEGLCPICAVPLDTYGGELDRLGSTTLASLRRDDPLTLTWCKAQCGVNFHRACIWIWDDTCDEGEIETTCPHCRAAWQDTDVGYEIPGNDDYWENWKVWRARYLSAGSA